MKKLNNKGFSLVELIIVIAIMAILVGVVGTQVIPYLEKSRQGKDMQIFSAWNTAGMSAYSMNADKVKSTVDVVITIQAATVGVTNGGSDAESAIASSFCELTGLKATGGTNFDGFVSRAAKDASAGVDKVVITIPAGDDSGSNITTSIQHGTEVVAAFGVIENK